MDDVVRRCCVADADAEPKPSLSRRRRRSCSIFWAKSEPRSGTLALAAIPHLTCPSPNDTPSSHAPHHETNHRPGKKVRWRA